MLHSRTRQKFIFYIKTIITTSTASRLDMLYHSTNKKEKNKENRSVPTAAVEEPKGVHDANACHWPLDLTASPHLHSHWRSTNCPRADGHHTSMVARI